MAGLSAARIALAISRSPRHQPLASIYNEDKEIRVRDRAVPALEHELVQRILTRAEHAAGVDQLELRVLPLDPLRQDVTRGAGNGRHDRAARIA